MKVRKIAQRDAIEISIDEGGDICIKQTPLMQDEQVIWILRDDIPLFIEYLQVAYTDAFDSNPEPESDE